MFRRDQIAPAAIAVTLLALAIGLILLIGVRSLGGNSTNATAKTGPRPSKTQQHAAGVLSTFVYERGTWYEGGNVKACQPNWRPIPNVVAQLHCRSFGRPSVVTRFRTGAQASAYYEHLASQGRPAAGSWGGCQRHVPAANWTRTILGDEKETGRVAFRQSGGKASVVWIWPNMRAVGQASGRLSQRMAICHAFDLNA